MVTKLVQPDFFAQEKHELQSLRLEEFKGVATKSIRRLFSRCNELELLVIEMHRHLDRLTEEVFKNV